MTDSSGGTGSLRVTRVVLFGIGSPIIVDVEESLCRAGHAIAAGVRNHPGQIHIAEAAPILKPEDLSAEWLDLPYLVPLFTPANRQAAAGDAARAGMRHPFNLVDPSVVLPRRLEMGPGTYVNVGCSVGSACSFGSFVFVNRGAGIGHHVRLGAFVSIGPGAVLCGQVTVGAGSVVGAGATILSAVTIGQNAVVAAGSVVTQDVPDRGFAGGNPARIQQRAAGNDDAWSVA